ncbi:hypothetical protein TRFO_15417 [Tritrichomonas foetus]|uniref:Protein kinase domain-containing protein n=1 Tax=Tritrichomonas foetus TaxID=1144522 RepID=A0A1J4KSM0_9EUKA|nr:hypothetical protein TRFO_15417 [Tritrichomonas foetus]|eukprot:OHT14259.1 hypothetical protein TRFO_15417 [Tritrichomonas foetus]
MHAIGGFSNIKEYQQYQINRKKVSNVIHYSNFHKTSLTKFESQPTVHSHEFDAFQIKNEQKNVHKENQNFLKDPANEQIHLQYIQNHMPVSTQFKQPQPKIQIDHSTQNAIEFNPNSKIHQCPDLDINRPISPTYILNKAKINDRRNLDFTSHDESSSHKDDQEGTPEVISIPFSFGKYERLYQIGEGATSIVLLCRHTEIGQTYACKVVNKMKLISMNMMDRFLHEIHIMKSLSHHHIVEIYEIIDDENYIYIICEYCSKGSLSKYIGMKEKLSFLEITDIFSQIVQGIQYIHENGVVHRDIKLENILLTKDSVVKLCDFGLSRQVTNETLCTTICGSDVFAAPEIILGKKYNGFKADLWSLGVVLYILSCLQIPWDTTSTPKMVNCIINAEYKIPPFVNKEIQDVIHGLLVLDPNKRMSIYDLMKSPLLNPKRSCVLQNNPTKLFFGSNSSDLATISAPPRYKSIKPMLIQPHLFNNYANKHNAYSTSSSPKRGSNTLSSSDIHMVDNFHLSSIC